MAVTMRLLTIVSVSAVAGVTAPAHLDWISSQVAGYDVLPTG